jgi:CubicO group peptidase (beta-lactamase class C family)
MKRLIILAATLLAGLTPLLHAADWPLPVTTPAAAGFSTDRLDHLHRTLAASVDTGRYAGYVVLLARDGQIVDWRAHGWQDVTARKPMARDSIVQIYSMTKIVTSVAVLMLLEDGKLKLDDPVEKFLPALKARQVLTGGTADVPVLTPASRSLTVRDLLTHTAGYYYDADWSAGSPVAIALFQRAKIWEATDLADFVTRVAKLPLLDQPGTRYRYGINLDLLGAMVEKASGQRLDVFFRERIFAPLGMPDTGFDVAPDKAGRLAKTYQRGADGRLAEAPALFGTQAVSEGRGLLSGGGGLRSTAGDYARFAQMLLNGGQLDGVRLLSRKTVELMTRNHIAHLADPHPFSRPELGFGLGVRMVTDLGRSATLGSPGMFGWDGAATTLVWMDPQERLVAILLTQHFPYNQDDIFATFMNGAYSALVD